MDDNKLNPDYDETVAGKEGWKVAEETPTAAPDAPSTEEVKSVEQPKGNPDYDESVAGKEGWKVIGSEEGANEEAPGEAPMQPQGNADYDETVAGKEGWKVAEETPAASPEAPSVEEVRSVEQPKGNPDYDETVAGKQGWNVAGETQQTAEAKAEPVPVPVKAESETSNEQAKADETKKILAGVIGIVIPGIGIHNFIYGYITKGIIQAVLYIVGVLTACFGIGFLFIAGSVIWCIVESVMILTGNIKPAPKK